MTSNGFGLSWIILSPIAVLTDVAAIAIVCHYKPFYHGSDVMVISLIVAMTMNALLIVPIPACTELGYFDWNAYLCKFYVWAFVTFRVVQMLSLSAICFHWSTIFKASCNNQNKGLTYRIKIISVIIWILSTIIGLLPIIGAVPDEFFGAGSCRFLSSDIGIGFTVFIFIFVVTCMCIAIISICDVTFLTKCMKSTAHIKYGAGRFYLPNKRSDIPGTYSTQEKFNQLNFTWDLCRFFCIVISFCFIGNHLPFVILEFMQSTTGFNRSLVQEIILWLILMEALLFPHLLWSCSRRYRHALVFTWRVHILRRPSEEEEDPMSCRLQSYSRKVRDINGYTNNAHDVPDVSRTVTAVDDINNTDIVTGNTSSPTPEIVLHPINNGRIEYSRTESVSSQNTPEANSETKEKETNFSTFHAVVTPVHIRSGSGGLNIKMGAADLQRSSSGSSRQEWKEQMRKKHLPPFFTNDSFTAESNSLPLPQETKLQSEGMTGSVHSLYYLSGDYHPDYLNTDSLPRHRIVGDEDGSNNNISAHEHHRMNSDFPPSKQPDIRLQNQAVASVNVNAKDSFGTLNSKDTDSNNLTQKDLQTPVCAEEIDIYIYKIADEKLKTNTNAQNKKLLLENDGNDQQNFTDTILNELVPGINDVREPAEGCDGEDVQVNSRKTVFNGELSVNQEHTGQKFPDNNWSDIVEPILKKNETDELDVSLTSCDPTWRHLRNYKFENSRPVSHSPFDRETDKGFEEALSVEYKRSISSLTSDSFGDSINVSNPFDFVDDFKNESFKTQAIVSKSRPASCSTVESDNPFDYVPIETRRDVIRRSFSENISGQRPLFSTFKSSHTNSNTTHEDFGDSFFESNIRDIKTSTPNTNASSPWPAIPEQTYDEDLVFESNFDTIKSNKINKQSFDDKSKHLNELDYSLKSENSENTELSGSLTMDVEPVFL
ncbi:uncharacterized protein LOC134692784 [Mytilus trossulus]|uniref:uncharacterized protein LOC134692784 n=1 Tax=Mytilus trossulus TaxID=6551 RepID=UPI00300444A6